MAQVPIGGTALINGGVIAKNSTIEIKDDRGWGRFSGRVIEGQKDDYNTTNLAIISYYGPVQGTGGTWGAQEKKMELLPKNEKKKDPMAQGLRDLGVKIKEIEAKYKCNTIVMGDFNINLNKKGTKRNMIVEWAEENQLAGSRLVGQLFDGGVHFRSLIHSTNVENRFF